MPDFRYVHLPKGSVEHWSTAMYGGSSGDMYLLDGPSGTNETILTIHAPRTLPGQHGGLRRIDIHLTPTQLDELRQMVNERKS